VVLALRRPLHPRSAQSGHRPPGPARRSLRLRRLHLLGSRTRGIRQRPGRRPRADARRRTRTSPRGCPRRTATAASTPPAKRSRTVGQRRARPADRLLRIG
jgi:hypothetical protein